MLLVGLDWAGARDFQIIILVLFKVPSIRICQASRNRHIADGRKSRNGFERVQQHTERVQVLDHPTDQARSHQSRIICSTGRFDWRHREGRAKWRSARPAPAHSNLCRGLSSCLQEFRTGAGRRSCCTSFLDDSRNLVEDDDGGFGPGAAVTQTRAHNVANELTGISGGVGGTWISPVYDAAGNMTQAPKPGAETTRIWLKNDAWNRLAEVDSDAGGSPGAALGTYRYDGLNRRISKTAGTDTFDYYYNENWQVLEVRKNGSSNPLEQWVWDQRYIDAPVLRWHDSNTDGTVDDTLYATNDANMNVTALVDAATGSVVERYAYDPYGKVRVMDGSWGSRSSLNYDWPVLYAGYWCCPDP